MVLKMIQKIKLKSALGIFLLFILLVTGCLQSKPADISTVGDTEYDSATETAGELADLDNLEQMGKELDDISFVELEQIEIE